MSTHLNECAEFWNRFPCNARRGDPTAGDVEYFGHIRANKSKAEPHLMPFMELYRWQGKEVLDVGCGLGSQAVWFARAGAWVTATDFSEQSLALAERHRFAAGDRVAEHILTQRIDYERDIYPRRHFDLIWAWGSLHHMRDPARVLRGLRAHCARDTSTLQHGNSTVLKLMVYHRKSTKVWGLKLRHGRDWRLWTEANGPVPVSDAYTVPEAIRMVELAGWQVTKAGVTHIFQWKIPEYQRGLFLERFPWNLVPKESFRHLESRYGFHILIEARPR